MLGRSVSTLQFVRPCPRAWEAARWKESVSLNDHTEWSPPKDWPQTETSSVCVCELPSFQERWEKILALLCHSFYSFLTLVTDVYEMPAIHNIWAWHHGDYKDDPCCEGTWHLWEKYACTQNHNKRQNGTIGEQSVSCIRIKERPYPTRIRKSFLEEEAFELSFEGWIEFSWMGGIKGQSAFRKWGVGSTPHFFPFHSKDCVLSLSLVYFELNHALDEWQCFPWEEQRWQLQTLGEKIYLLPVQLLSILSMWLQGASYWKGCVKPIRQTNFLKNVITLKTVFMGLQISVWETRTYHMKMPLIVNSSRQRVLCLRNYKNKDTKWNILTEHVGHEEHVHRLQLEKPGRNIKLGVGRPKFWPWSVIHYSCGLWEIA